MTDLEKFENLLVKRRNCSAFPPTRTEKWGKKHPMETQLVEAAKAAYKKKYPLRS